MKLRLYFLLFFIISKLICFSQTNDKILLQRLDSVKCSSSIASYFASIYLTTTQNAIHFFSKYKEPVRASLQRLEDRFAEYFFRSAEACCEKKEIPAEWKEYYSNSFLSPLQYRLLGINAHINGDIWKALITEFTLEEIMRIKKYYFNFNRGLREIYFNFYNEASRGYSKIRWLHLASLGTDKSFGEMMLLRWRNRQMRLAVLYYTHPTRFNKQHRKLEKKMQRLNNLILRVL